MEPRVSIIMGSTSDLGVMEAAAKVLNDFEIPFEINAFAAASITPKSEVLPITMLYRHTARQKQLKYLPKKQKRGALR